MKSIIVLALSLLVQLSFQQKNPLTDFCRRFGHQTAVIDGRLYIDGGFVDWNPISQNDKNYTNTWLLYNDLNSSPAGVGMPQLSANLSKNNSVPDVSGGILWADAVNKRFYLYGGDYNGISPNSLNLLSYDVIYDQWEYFGAPSTPINSVSWGGGVGISEIGQGYVLGGWLSNASVPGWIGGPLATSTLIKYQYGTGVWTNNTGPDNNPRAEGVMVYIPAGGNGLLVYFGGVTAPYDNTTILSSPMDAIYIYDIASGRWYTQTATGQVPPDRRRFCAGAAWASDQSSYNIYLYGGLGFGSNYAGFDDVYILSLPSFQWIQWWEGSNPPNPHNSLSCNVVNKGQMLVIGGTFPLTESCDYTPTWGTHNMDLGKVSNSSWADYNTNITSYVVPPEVIAVVGGSSFGGATATKPAGGFDNGDLAVYFTQQATAASRSPTRPIPSPTESQAPTSSTNKLSNGAIAGIAIAGVAVLVALLLGAYCFRCRRQNEAAQSQQMPGLNDPQALHIPQDYYHSPYNPQRRYQLEDNPAPVELSSSNCYARGDATKDATIHDTNETQQPTMIHHIDDNQQPVYARWNQSQQSPSMHSSHPSTYSPATDYPGTNTSEALYGGPPQPSPAPTYVSTTTGRGLRKPLPNNETIYSP